VVTWQQLLGLMSKDRARWLKDGGWLHRVHQGVYAVGNPVLTPRGKLRAAQLAYGGALSHRSAGFLHELCWPFWRTELTRRTPGGSDRRVLIHRSRLSIATEDMDGLKVTTREQTLLDLADVLTSRQIEQAINQAEIHGLDHSKLKTLLVGANGRHGITPLKIALEAHRLGLTLTASQLEEEFLELTRTHGFAQPQVNAHVLGYQCDFVWPTQRIVIETDGAKYHRQLRNKERDAARDRHLRRAGWAVDRLSYRQVFFQADAAALILEESGVPRVSSPRRRRRARRPRSGAPPRRTA
jgi:very-short-patch-repair endonuclease